MTPLRRLLALPLVLLGACTTTPDAQHPMDQGWRVAHVDHEVALDESTPLVRFSEDCRSLMPSAQTYGVRWALLHFRRPPEEVFRVVPLKDGQHLKEEQTVYVNVDNCTQAVEIR